MVNFLTPEEGNNIGIIHKLNDVSTFGSVAEAVYNRKDKSLWTLQYKLEQKVAYSLIKVLRDLDGKYAYVTWERATSYRNNFVILLVHNPLCNNCHLISQPPCTWYANVVLGSVRPDT